MILEAFAALLAQAGLGTVGTDVFVGRMPETPDGRCTGLYALGEAPRPYAEGLRGTDFRVACRAADERAAWAMAEAARAALWLDQATVAGAFVWDCRPFAGPLRLSQDGDALALVAINFESAWRAA